MCDVSRKNLLASELNRIMTSDISQAGQHRPSGGRGFGGGQQLAVGASRKPKRNPNKGSCCLFKRAAKPSTVPNLGVKHSQRQCEL